MNANFYILDWNRLVGILLPTSLRGAKMISWLNALFSPVKTLHSQFLIFKSETIYKIEHTPQVYSIEKVLNDEFDPDLKRIFIEDGEYFEQLYVFSPQEQQPIYVFEQSENQPVYVYAQNDPEATSVDFNVVLPLTFQNAFAVDTNERNKLEALINFYRLPDKTYKIIFE